MNLATTSAGHCKLCGLSSDFVDAHIVPRSFYPDRAKGDDALIVVNSRPGARNSRSRIGIYDERMLCRSCEERFSIYDDYAAKLLVELRGDWQTVLRDGEPLAYRIENFHYSKLKIFCLFLLWRAAATDRVEFGGVKLGTFMERLTELLLSEDPGNPEEFSPFIARFSDVTSWQSGMISPFREKYDGVSVYRFVVGAYVIYIKVDSQKLKSQKTKSAKNLFVRRLLSFGQH